MEKLSQGQVESLVRGPIGEPNQYSSRVKVLKHRTSIGFSRNGIQWWER